MSRMSRDAYRINPNQTFFPNARSFPSRVSARELCSTNAVLNDSFSERWNMPRSFMESEVHNEILLRQSSKAKNFPADKCRESSPSSPILAASQNRINIKFVFIACTSGIFAFWKLFQSWCALNWGVDEDSPWKRDSELRGLDETRMRWNNKIPFAS